MAISANTIAIVRRNLRPEGPILSAQVGASEASGVKYAIRPTLKGSFTVRIKTNGPFRASILSQYTQASARVARSDLG